MEEWARATQKLSKAQAALFTKGKRRNHTYQSGPKKGKTERKLRNHIQYGLRSDSGEVAGVAFGFERHGIFLEYGVGRGHPAHGIRRSMSDWLSGTLQKKEQGVIDIVATYQSDKYIRTFMGIKK